jgi:hypothetical protein
MVGCTAVPEHFADAIDGPANPKAAEAPATHPSRALDPAVASAEMGPSRPEFAGPSSSEPTTSKGEMKGMDMPAMGGMDMPGMAGMKMGSGASQPASQPATTQVAAYYTCGMHPEIHQDHPGVCPICGMTLVKKDAGQGDQKGAGK